MFQVAVLLLAGAAGILLAWSAGSMSGQGPEDSGPKQSGQHQLAAESGEENCFMLHPEQRLSYQFQASAPVSFDVHYHIGEQIHYTTRLPETAEGRGNVIPEVRDTFCLYWENRSDVEVQVTYSGEILPHTPEQQQVRTNVRLRYQESSQQIQAFDLSGNPRLSISVEAPVLNFSLNNKATLLAVLVAETAHALRVYDLQTAELRYSLPLDQAPRFLVFSGDDRFLALGDEHLQQVTVLELESAREQQLLLPEAPQSFSAADREPEFFLARLEGEVIKLRFDPPEVVERRTKIELAFGEETILADPEEVCFVHGVPHPLYAPTPEAMSPEGLLASILLPRP
jgi:hypothetical protein